MYSITPEHAIGLVGGLLALAVVLFARRLHPRWRLVPGTVQAAAVLMAVSGGVHLALIPHHLATQPLTSALFLVNGLMFIALSASFTWRHWRLASAALLITTVLGYLVYVGIGFEGPDQVGLATKLVEVTALGLALVPVRGEKGRTHRSWRWASLGVAMPLLVVLTGATVWIVDIARPDARHIHAGALLRSTNAIPTPAQVIVYANTHHGPVLLGDMFQMKGLNHFGPDPGGPMTAWHQHENICITPFGFEFSLMTPFATCPIGAIDISASPMLHVWIVDNPHGGPFAVDIDESVVAALDRT